MLPYARSFFERQVLERRSSATNPLLEVVLVNGKKLLNGPNVNYSYGSLQRVFDEAFLHLALPERAIARALLLGCGGGSVVRLLRERYAPGAAITAVELDPAVLDIARRHFQLDRLRDVSLVEADAAAWVARAKERFDLVVVDVFVDEEIPASCQTPAFLEHAARALAPGGMLVYNRLDHSPHRRAETDLFEALFRATLPGSRSLEVRTNRILVHERPAGG